MSSVRIGIYDKLPWIVPRALPHSIAWPTFKSSPKYPPTCQVGSHVDFSSIANVVGCSPKLPSCKPIAGARMTLNQLRIQGLSRAIA